MSSPVQALAGVPNACQILPSVITGGQPSPSHIAALHAAGGAIVLDLRDPMERRPFDEPAAVAASGMEYVNVPVGPGTLTDQTLERVLEVLRSAGDRLVLLHCASGNRVGAVLIPHLILDHGMDEEDVVGQAMRVGLRSAELMEWGLDYARRNKGT